LENPHRLTALRVFYVYAGDARVALGRGVCSPVVGVPSSLASPVNGRGLVETILQQDEDRLKRAVLRGHLACIFLGVGPTSQTTIPVSLSDLGTLYAVEAKSPNGTMVYLAPRH